MKNLLRTITIILAVAATLVTPAEVFAKNEACRDVKPTCKDVEKDIDGAPFICKVCSQALCKDGGDQIVGNKETSECTSKPTGFRPIRDDDASFDTTSELAPKPESAGTSGKDSIVAPSNFTSALVIVPPKRCGAGSTKLCASNGATCDLIHDRSGEAREVCRWSKQNNVAACKRTGGIWTSKTSKYGKNHPDAIRSGNDGACITEVKNLKPKKTPNRTDHRSSILQAPSNLSANKTSSSAVALSWTDNSDSEFGVELYRIDPVAARSGQGADWEFVGLFEERADANVKGTGLRADQDYGLTPDTRYCYRLRAYAGFDRSTVSAFSETVCTTTKP